MYNIKIMNINLKPEILFVILSIIFGIIFLLITPQFQVADETSHYSKSLELSQGNIYFGKSNVFIYFYSPIPYMLPASALSLGSSLGLSNNTIFYMGRLLNLIFFICITFLAIKITPILKWTFLLLGLMPMSLYEAASYSSDAFNIAIALFLTAFIFKLAFDENKITINQKDMIIIFLLGLLLALSKQIYVLILFLFLIIPSSKFESRKSMFINFFTILFSCILVIIGWNLLIQGMYTPISPQVSVSGQISFILTHPITFLVTYLNTIIQNSLYYIITFVGTFGWIDNGLDTPLPTILVIAYIIVLILASLLDNSEVKVNLNQKLISFFTFLFIFTSIFTLEYVMWTVVGNDKINGVFGRYFIPIAPLFFLVFYNNKFKQNIKGKNFAITIFIIVILLISTFMVFKRFYT